MLKVLVPVDGSPNALRAVRHAIDEYRRHHELELHLLNVQPRFSRHISRFVGRQDLRSVASRTCRRRARAGPRPARPVGSAASTAPGGRRTGARDLPCGRAARGASHRDGNGPQELDHAHARGLGDEQGARVDAGAGRAGVGRRDLEVGTLGAAGWRCRCRQSARAGHRLGSSAASLAATATERRTRVRATPTGSPCEPASRANTKLKLATACAISDSRTTPATTCAVSTTIGQVASCARSAAISLTVLVSPTIQSITNAS